ncbi:MAG: 30S ribosomal protein S20 [Vulcanimicrobiaceae bacterium]
MPNIKAAEKWARQSERRRVRNLNVTSRLKTIFKKAVLKPEAQPAETVESAFDKAASKGIIHPNKAARKKGRLAAAVKRAESAPKAVKATTRAKSGAAKKASSKKNSTKKATNA